DGRSRFAKALPKSPDLSVSRLPGGRPGPETADGESTGPSPQPSPRIERSEARRRAYSAVWRMCSAWLCYTPDLLQRAGAAVLIDDVMNCKTARDDIKTSILKRQFPHIARMQFDTFPNAFQRRVAQRRASLFPD